MDGIMATPGRERGVDFCGALQFRHSFLRAAIGPYHIDLKKEPDDIRNREGRQDSVRRCVLPQLGCG